jgi:hypothetical protein
MDTNNLTKLNNNTMQREENRRRNAEKGVVRA